MKEQYLKLLEQMVNIDSGTGDREGLTQMMGLIVADTAGLGFNPQRLSGADGSEHLYLSRGTGNRVLLLAHLDTVFGKGTAAARPFTLDGDLARGPGVSDCKSGVVTILGALRQLAQDAAPDGAIGCLFNTDEEIGSPGSRALIEKLARGSRVVLVVEPAEEADSVIVARKGIGRFYLETFGKAAHSGGNFTAGRNAILELARQVTAVSALTDLTAGVTLNVGVIQGGSRVNIVPDYAVAEIDLRIKASGQEQRVIDQMRRIAATPRVSGVTAKLSGGITRPPMERTARNLRLYELLCQIGARLGIKLAPVESGGGSDANFAAAVGVPVLDGLGPIGGGLHSEAEYLYLPSLTPRVNLLVESIQEILSGEGQWGRL
jgi:glutamate carboxypeptidase